MSIERLGYYAFYGTLRQGMENHLAFAKALAYLKTETLTGYRMYSLGEYPYIVYTGHANDLIVVDLFHIANSEAEEMIHEMEIDAGYILSSVVIDGSKFGIYLFVANQVGDELLPGGDWVAHARGQSF
ncbi:MAG TPA: gamma-glutamylcyclotransferase family protein [Chryseolinea sp.]|nr:gamma-glutamylcyclotransferase family protein [Chryseolinea sp.]